MWMRSYGWVSFKPNREAGSRNLFEVKCQVIEYVVSGIGYLDFDANSVDADAQSTLLSVDCLSPFVERPDFVHNCRVAC